MITKSEFQAMKGTTETLEDKDFERIVDREIGAAAENHRNIRVSTEGVSPGTLERTKSKLLEAGWGITTVPDGRDGAYIELS